MRPVGKRLKSAILIDESNAMHQLHDVGVGGFRSWKKFYQSIEQYLKSNYGQKMVTDFNFYGTLPPKGHVEDAKYNSRYKFFEALQYDGINVLRGECYFQDDGSLKEKQLDVLMALDIYELSVYKYEYIVVFSGDADFVPAIERAQKNGSTVFAVLGKNKSAFHLKNSVDVIINLESIIQDMDKKTVIPSKTTWKVSN
ncbi:MULTISPECIES: NYN domain-containing protein [unclassified Paenibacillus]|uniref:NYN domain-containing protein n=1 Tax=Paenibacillus provencensis TaxID=441151 RepID=A0ABW3PYP0_9BACL|nr:MULTISPECIES: NYN domain-containing protein [unclassified Paenibacillus]SDX74452.1 Uncharacterized conserved protein, LabA/DUF88 family [Paenibacillus sp. PDC88]SFS89814.1 Uncharacterized conserved protein, LabA/DUF88 family [Paenibacillus sp. 453mf]